MSYYFSPAIFPRNIIFSNQTTQKKEKKTKLNMNNYYNSSAKKNIHTNQLVKLNNNFLLKNKNNYSQSIHYKNENLQIKKSYKNNFSKNTINSLSFQNPKQQITNLVNSNSGKLTSATSLSSQNSSESIKNNYPLNEVDSNEMYYRLNTKETKNFYNKFNSQSLHKNIADRSNINENTVILILKIKVGKNDFRTFSLKKYDDLFISLEKFFDINKISQELIKPVIIKVFAALNKTFWLLNNKVEKKDQKYLYSLYKLYLKNKTNNNNNKCISKNKKGDKSSSISNDSSNEKNKMKLKKFNSEKNINNNSNSSISINNNKCNKFISGKKAIKKPVKTI